MVKKRLDWDDVVKKVPAYADDDGIHWATGQLLHPDQEEPDTTSITYGEQNVPLSKIKIYHHVDLNNPRVRHAIRGYQSGADVPPVVLAKVAPHEYHIADGHHRVSAAIHLGLTHVKAFVGK